MEMIQIAHRYHDINVQCVSKTRANLKSISTSQNASIYEFFIEIDCLGAYNVA